MGWFSNRKLRAAQKSGKAPGPPTQPQYRGQWAQGGGQFSYPNMAGPGSVPFNAFDPNALPGAWPLGIPNVDSSGILDSTGQHQPLPQTLYEQLIGSSSTRYQRFTGHSFAKARLPDPGAPQWTFDALALVEFTPVGTGIVNRDQLRPLEGAPLFPTLGVTTQGLGGLVMGEIVGQQLVLDPSTETDLQVGI